SVAPELKDRVITTNGVSKAYGMSGWRIGFAGGPPHVLKAMTKLQSQATSNPTTVSQHAALAALDGPMDFMAGNVERFKARRDMVVGRLNAIDGLCCHVPRGAFYAFVDCSAVIGKTTPQGRPIGSDVAFAEFLLEEHGVALVPGSAFGAPGYIRISYSVPDDHLQRACDRIGTAIESLR
ncbi:MAG: aminotransferase class I/II-fold pyridoxal phosphate-dependent enzyme, partial [Hyphomicrobiaceae bacterium]